MRPSSKNREGDIDVLVLKFAHILRKNLAIRQMMLGKEIDAEKHMTLKAEMIQSQKLLSGIVKSLDQAIDEFRKDAQNAGALYPKHRKAAPPAPGRRIG
jgi:hypothetical protein